IFVEHHVCIFDVFFFSSRRRHTRFSRDWSSDVCSSDLLRKLSLNGRRLKEMLESNSPSSCFRRSASSRTGEPAGRDWATTCTDRSEERRVGKECRSRWSPDHEKKKEKRHGVVGERVGYE